MTRPQTSLQGSSPAISTSAPRDITPTSAATLPPATATSAWNARTASGSRFSATPTSSNQPSMFTTFAGFEWTAGFKRVGMLHRNVIFRGGKLPDSVLSAVELNNTPERLWEWLERDCTGDCQVISIPHNTNWGWGRDFATENSDGTPFTRDGLRRRVKTEPIVESPGQGQLRMLNRPRHRR